MSDEFEREDDGYLPPCGIYRTGRPLPGDEEHLPSGRLVYFHNHSDAGPPIVCCPDENHQNRWRFQLDGHVVEDPDFIAALEPLLAEGLYVLKQHLHLSETEVLPDRTLVQLGYNRNAEPILFPGRFEKNSIHFPSSGYGFDTIKIFANLEPVNFLVPEPVEELH